MALEKAPSRGVDLMAHGSNSRFVYTLYQALVSSYSMCRFILSRIENSLILPLADHGASTVHLPVCSSRSTAAYQGQLLRACSSIVVSLLLLVVKLLVVVPIL